MSGIKSLESKVIEMGQAAVDGIASALAYTDSLLAKGRKKPASKGGKKPTPATKGKASAKSKMAAKSKAPAKSNASAKSKAPAKSNASAKSKPKAAGSARGKKATGARRKK